MADHLAPLLPMAFVHPFPDSSDHDPGPQASGLLWPSRKKAAGNAILFTLSVDCLNCLFDLIPCQDQVTMGSTCKDWRLVVDQRMQSVIHLDTGGTHPEPAFPKLRSLSCLQAEDPLVLLSMLKQCPNVRQLTISTAKLRLTSFFNMFDIRINLTSYMTQLECLTAPEAVLCEEDVVNLKNLTHLQCFDITAEALEILLPQLKVLRIENTDFAGWEKLPQGMTHLEIVNSSDPVNVSLKKLCSSSAAKTIVELKLNPLPGGMWPQVRGIDRFLTKDSFAHLKSLQLGKIKPFVSHHLAFVTQLLEVGQITHLSLTDYEEPEPENHLDRSFVESLKGLTKLDLLINDMLTVDGLYHLERIAVNNPDLAELSLRLPFVTTELVPLLSKFKTLIKLQIQSPYLNPVNGTDLTYFLEKLFSQSLSLVYLSLHMRTKDPVLLQNKTLVRLKNNFGLRSEWKSDDLHQLLRYLGRDDGRGRRGELILRRNVPNCRIRRNS